MRPGRAGRPACPCGSRGVLAVSRGQGAGVEAGAFRVATGRTAAAERHRCPGVRHEGGRDSYRPVRPVRRTCIRVHGWSLLWPARRAVPVVTLRF